MLALSQQSLLFLCELGHLVLEIHQPIFRHFHIRSVLIAIGNSVQQAFYGDTYSFIQISDSMSGRLGLSLDHSPISTYDPNSTIATRS